MAMKALIVAGGVPPGPKLIKAQVEAADFVIAADSGADALVDFDIEDLTLVGDFDSISPNVLETYKNRHVRVQQSSTHKDETDTFLAMDAAMERGAKTIVVLGAFGRRLDHTFANIALLMYAEKRRTAAILMDETTEVFLAKKETRITVDVGANISLFSLSRRCRFVSSAGLSYSLDGLTLFRSRPIGISNEAVQNEVIIRKKYGKALVMISGQKKGRA